MKIKITLDNGEAFECEGDYAPSVMLQVARDAEIIDEDDTIVFMTFEQERALD